MKHDFRVRDSTSQTNPFLKRKSGLKLSKFYGNLDLVYGNLDLVYAN